MRGAYGIWMKVVVLCLALSSWISIAIAKNKILAKKNILAFLRGNIPSMFSDHVSLNVQGEGFCGPTCNPLQLVCLDSISISRCCKTKKRTFGKMYWKKSWSHVLDFSRSGVFGVQKKCSHFSKYQLFDFLSADLRSHRDPKTNLRKTQPFHSDH